ncbi:2'-5' RNA ligase family protein [Candidatus Woesearchaeota archaeon]|nr:2'-5' RNA ligase family protein [Candidatus Woesearchaeota archaeon]
MLKLGVIIEINLPKVDKKIIEINNKFSIRHYSYLPPHISIYIWESNNELNNIVKKIKTITKSFDRFYIKINKLNFSKYHTIQLKVSKNPILNKFHKIIIEEMSKYRDKTAPSKTKEFYPSFNEEERKLIDKFGRLNILNNFEPHITLEKFPVELTQKIKEFLSDFKPKFNIEIKEVSLLEIKKDNYKTIKKIKLNI